MKPVRVYLTMMCPYCQMARRLLEEKGVPFEEIRVDQDRSRREEMMRVSGRHTVPQIFVGETHVGGFDDLYALERAGKFDALLEAG